MNIWEFVQSNRNQSKLKFKKWSDAKSDHFFSLELDTHLYSYAIQKKLAKRNAEEYNETGNHLIYVSSGHAIVENDIEIPVFLSSVSATINRALKSITWTIDEEVFYLNPDAIEGHDTIHPNEIESWLEANHTRLKSKICICPKAFYFNVNTRKSIEEDLKKIYEQRASSLAMNALFNSEITYAADEPKLDFLSLHHFLPMDSSQAKTILAAETNSIVISGPPGTGKSQTILNIALEELSKNKRVAIISEKQAALDVLIQRAKEIDLNRFVLALPFHKKEIDVIREIENSLDRILNFEPSDSEYPFNFSYYAHAIRTLEDYFNASKNLQKSNLNSRIQSKNINTSLRHSPLYWIQPKEDLLNLDLTKASQTLADIKRTIIGLAIDFKTEKFSLFKELDAIIDMLASYDLRSLNRWLNANSKAKKSWLAKRKKLVRVETKIKKLKTLDLELPDASIDYIKAYYLRSNFISKLFDKEAKRIENSIAQKERSWNHKSMVSKLADLDSNIRLNQFKSEYRDAKDALDEIELEYHWKNTIPIFEYIESKIRSGIPIWTLIFEYYIQDQNFESKKILWFELTKNLAELKNLKVDLSEILISELINEELTSEIEISKSEWDALCCLHFARREDWIAYLEVSQNRVFTEPVLKNYSKREIANFALYCRRNYSAFIAFRSHSWLNQRMREKQQALNETLRSRKSNLRSQKDEWKKSIEFIQKKWSQKRKKISLYQFFQNASFEFVTWLKPISILSFEQLSQFSPLEREFYDTLIIDESSQVELINSIPALYRSKKIIIVGDSKQLTPSRFFRNAPHPSMDSYESLLELAEEKLQKFGLNCHYRSKYKELIGYSNIHFYENQLQATRLSRTNSIYFQYIPEGRYVNRKNIEEAKELIRYLISNLNQWQNKSIGIICFSLQQKEAIEDLLDDAIDANPALRIQLNLQREKSEFFFVKNIENVQGDERDIILISIGYGKNKDDRIYQFFGPILSFQGENRLNVLMSRAKEKLAVFSSLRAIDIHIKPQSSNGLKLFQKLLGFAENHSESTRTSTPNYTNYWEYFLHPFRN